MEDDQKKYGFERDEMKKEELKHTVYRYTRHIFLVYQTRQEWESRFDVIPSFPKYLIEAMKAREMSDQCKLTICERSDLNGLNDGDCLIFPDMIKYRGLDESKVESFLENVILKKMPGVYEPVEDVIGKFIFVCAHNSRDKRCGLCGPNLIEKFNEEIAAKELKEKVFVSACSHLFGCHFAGNLIIYSKIGDEVSGNWYGYVTPKDVAELIEQHIINCKIVKRIWRGQMRKENKSRTKEEVTHLEKEDNSRTKEAVTDLDTFIRKKEQQKGGIMAFASVVGCMATIALAYSLYKRSR